MGDNISIDWSAGSSMSPEGPLGVANSGYKGALMGYDLGQKRATIHALQGIDLNNPQSIDAGIGNLVHANALEQGNALQNLAFTRQLRQQIPGLLESLSGQSDQTAQPTADPNHVIQTWSMAKDAADGLSQLPADQRPAAFAKIKADMLARGVPEQAIDAAGADLSDAGLKSLSDHYGELIAHGQHQLSGGEGEAPPMPQAHPSNAWYQNVVANPKVPLTVAMLKGAGMDLTPFLDTAKTLALPGIQKAAEVAAAPTLAGIDVAKTVAAAQGTAPIDVAKSVAIEAGTNPYKAALAQAQADIAAQHDTIKVPEVDKDGNPTGREVTYRKDVALDKGSKGAAIGKSQSPGEHEGQTQDASAFMKKYEAEANQSAIQADLNARDIALSGAKLAQTLSPSALTPWIAKNANVLQGLGFKIAAKDANNLAAYQQIIAQNVKNATSTFPRLTNEFHAVQDASANAKTPGDAAALALTETAAMRDMAAQEKQFRVKWAAEHHGEYSERAFQEAWSKSPGAYQSLFASPVFRDLKFNGKPAVVTQTYQDGPYKGQTWGVFMPGTPQRLKFRAN